MLRKYCPCPHGGNKQCVRDGEVSWYLPRRGAKESAEAPRSSDDNYCQTSATSWSADPGYDPEGWSHQGIHLCNIDTLICAKCCAHLTITGAVHFFLGFGDAPPQPWIHRFLPVDKTTN